jgi:hypothetical protein
MGPLETLATGMHPFVVHFKAKTVRHVTEARQDLRLISFDVNFNELGLSVFANDGIQCHHRNVYLGAPASVTVPFAEKLDPVFRETAHAVVIADPHSCSSERIPDCDRLKKEPFITNGPQKPNALRLGLTRNYSSPESKKRSCVLALVCSDIEHKISGPNELPVKLDSASCCRPKGVFERKAKHITEGVKSRRTAQSVPYRVAHVKSSMLFWCNQCFRHLQQVFRPVVWFVGALNPGLLGSLLQCSKPQ